MILALHSIHFLVSLALVQLSPLIFSVLFWTHPIYSISFFRSHFVAVRPIERTRLSSFCFFLFLFLFLFCLLCFWRFGLFCLVLLVFGFVCSVFVLVGAVVSFVSSLFFSLSSPSHTPPGYAALRACN